MTTRLLLLAGALAAPAFADGTHFNLVEAWSFGGVALVAPRVLALGAQPDAKLPKGTVCGTLRVGNGAQTITMALAQGKNGARVWSRDDSATSAAALKAGAVPADLAGSNPSALLTVA